jgi:hypothetical protein
MRVAALVVLAVLVACGSDAVAPRTVATVVVSSPIGARLAVGRTTQLSAEARDAAGDVVDDVAIAWASSATGVASVTTAGLVSGASAGSATIAATGSGVTGSLAMQVIAADLDGIVTTVNDAFAESLVANLTASVRTRVELALSQCETGADAGNFTTIEACLTAARAEVTAATDTTDRALLASLALYLDRIQILMNL